MSLQSTEADQTLAGYKLRILCVSDEFTRESLDIAVGRSFRSQNVCEVIEAVMSQRGVPRALRMDNGPEFIALALRGLCYRHGINSCYIDPGKPWHRVPLYGLKEWSSRVNQSLGALAAREVMLSVTASQR